MNKIAKRVLVAVMLIAVSAAFAQNAEIVKVKGRGIGVSRSEALKDAYRDAVERAVGLYVDAEQMMKNEELLKDQILTQSNAYVEKYEVVKEDDSANGLVEIQILAQVRKSALTAKLNGVMPRQVFRLGDDAQNVHSRAVTKEKRDVDAVALLKNALDGVNLVKQLVKVSLADNKPIMRKAQDGKERVYYRFRFTIDEDKYYNAFLPPLLKVLDQISLEPSKTVRFSSVEMKWNEDDEKWKETELRRYVNGEWDAEGPFRQEVRVDVDGRARFASGLSGDESDGGVWLDNIGFSDGVKSWAFSMIQRHCVDSVAQQEILNVRLQKDLARHKVFRVVVIVKMNRARTVIQAKEYAIPADCGEVVQKWLRDQWLGESAYSFRDGKSTSYNIVFSDETGEEVAAMPLAILNKAVSNVFFGRTDHLKQGSETIVALYVSPMVHCDATAYERWIGFGIPRDVLPTVKTVSVELAE